MESSTSLQCILPTKLVIIGSELGLRRQANILQIGGIYL